MDTSRARESYSSKQKGTKNSLCCSLALTLTFFSFHDFDGTSSDSIRVSVSKSSFFSITQTYQSSTYRMKYILYYSFIFHRKCNREVNRMVLHFMQLYLHWVKLGQFNNGLLLWVTQCSILFENYRTPSFDTINRIARYQFDQLLAFCMIFAYIK